jgi:uncharacterized protein YjdB
MSTQTLIYSRRIRRVTRLMLSPFAALALLVAIACSDNDPAGTPAPTPVAKVTVAPATQTLVIGASTTLTASLFDAAGKPISGRTVAWATNRPDVATVNANGVVTAVAEGVVQIDAVTEETYGTAIVVVVKAPVARVEITPATMSLEEGQIGALSATAYDAAGAILIGRTFAWQSADPTVATINANGDVTAVRAGAVAMTVESEGKSATVQVTVRAVPIATITVGPQMPSLEIGDVVMLTAVARDLAGRVLENRAITWTTSNAGVATISPNGQVIVRGAGTVTLTASSEGKTGSVTSIADAPPSATCCTSARRPSRTSCTPSISLRVETRRRRSTPATGPTSRVCPVTGRESRSLYR